MKKNTPLSIIVAMASVVAIAGCGGGGKQPSPSRVDSSSSVKSPSTAESHGDGDGHGDEDGHGHGYTTGSKDPRTAAANFVSMGPFSRAFTIAQLTSPQEGFSQDVAVKAVDSLHIDWKEQARRAAIDYMSIKEFTCGEMKDQLSATYANHFTQEEAKWGAEHSAACAKK